MIRKESFPKIDGFNLRIEDLIVWVPEVKKFGNVTPKKAILKGISTEFSQGTMTAIVGPSGSGKTTMMNYLSGRQDNSQAFRTYCNYFLNDERIEDISPFKNIVGYVMQEDILESRNSPRDIFRLYARLRGLKDQEEKVEEVLGVLNLHKCADTVVGDAFTRGLSGGEKKRTSIGVELISSPNLLFLDEPTTGLDSTTALDIVMNLAELKKSGITIICTIHQPSEEIMALFDKVVMLVDGNLVYDDSPYKIEEHLASLGFTKQITETPIEFFMKIVDKDDVKVRFLEEGKPINDDQINSIYNQRITNLHQHHKSQIQPSTAQRKRSENAFHRLIEISKNKNQKISIFLQVSYLFTYYTKLFISHWKGIVLKSIMALLLYTLFIISFYYVRDKNLDSILRIQIRGGFLFMNVLYFFFGMSSATSSLILPAKQIFFRDQQSRMYSPLAFFFAISNHIMPFYFILFSEFFIVDAFLEWTPPSCCCCRC